MASTANLSDIGMRSRRTRGIRSSKKSVLYSDYNEDLESKNSDSLGKRSISLTALTNGIPTPSNGANSVTGPGPPIEPRMAQLETLEAKMASIEVSLSTAPRRKNSKKTTPANSISGKITPINNQNTSISLLNVLKPNTIRDTCKELEMLRNALKDKENTIQNLQGQVNNGRLICPQPLDSHERRSAELRLQVLKQEEDNKKLAIKNINLTLEQIDATESNIDVRIRQAELEYELGREELSLLGIREEYRQLQARIEAKPAPTLFSCVSSSTKGILQAIQLEYDPKSPKFGAGNLEDKTGLFVLWAAEDSGLQKGDRVLEVNGKLTLATTKEEMLRLLTVCPQTAEIVVHRVWVPPVTVEDNLRRENLRLTHRISYLEDQVSEMLPIKEKTPSIASSRSSETKVEVFQKGPQVTLLSNPEVTKPIKHSTTVSITGSHGTKVLEEKEEYRNRRQDKCSESEGNMGPSQKYHEIDAYKTFQPKSHHSGDKIKALSRKYEKDEYSSALSGNDEYLRKQSINSKSIPSLDNPVIYSYSDVEKRTRKFKDYSKSKMVEYISENTCPRYKSHRDRSVKSLDLDCETPQDISYGRYKPHRDRTSKSIVDIDSDIQEKPAPPKKPIRLSIHKATSLQHVELCHPLTIRKIKRSYKGEAPPPPHAGEVSRVLVNGTDTSSQMSVMSGSSRLEPWRNQNNNWRFKTNRIDVGGEKWC